MTMPDAIRPGTTPPRRARQLRPISAAQLRPLVPLARRSCGQSCRRGCNPPGNGSFNPPQLRAVVPLGRHGWAQRHPASAGERTAPDAPFSGAHRHGGRSGTPQRGHPNRPDALRVPPPEQRPQQQLRSPLRNPPRTPAGQPNRHSLLPRTPSPLLQHPC
ncbi:hypothetical protein, partial [Streptomyces sp. KR55]|uniref:hypothetical protein n=1 Tax=Streptomyces sp. KR55 TaxID=3457425 RepID=UPI003FCFD6FF